MFSIGKLYKIGHGVEQDFAKANYWISKAKSTSGLSEAELSNGENALNSQQDDEKLGKHSISLLKKHFQIFFKGFFKKR